MKKSILFSALLVLVTLFTLSNIHAQYTNSTLTDNNEGGISFDRQGGFSNGKAQWFFSLRGNNQDLWLFNKTYGHSTYNYWNPIKLNYSAAKTIVLSNQVGINIEIPSYTLDVGGSGRVNGTMIINGESEQGMLSFTSTSVNGNKLVFLDANTGAQILTVKGGTSGHLDYNGTRLFNDGSVGIGTSTPGSTSYKLMVNGKIRAKEIIVETNWSDFVFEKNYNLLSLAEVESFIAKNKHLPDVPSEKEVMENGVSLGEMQSTLLQKIEELTLYVIDQNKRIEKLEKENAELKK